MQHVGEFQTFDFPAAFCFHELCIYIFDYSIAGAAFKRSFKTSGKSSAGFFFFCNMRKSQCL